MLQFFFFYDVDIDSYSVRLRLTFKTDEIKYWSYVNLITYTVKNFFSQHLSGTCLRDLRRR